MGNPTVNALEGSVAALENGLTAIAAASGMAAITTLFLALLEKNTHVVCTASVYSATSRVLQTALARFGVRSHSSVPGEERARAGILDELVSLSVGCEDFEDLRNDLEQPLNRIP